MTTPEPSPRVLVLAPMPSELGPCVRAFGLHRDESSADRFHVGTAGRAAITATMTGMGTRTATSTTERMIAAGDFDHVVVVGIAGGIGPTVEIGDVVIPGVVVDVESGAEFRPAPLGDAVGDAKLMTSGEFITDLDRIAGFQDQGAVAIDMETAAVAAVCERLGCAWSAVRAISDRADDGTADQAVFAMANPDGSPNWAAVARFVVTHPWQVPKLARLGRDSARAANAAARTAASACAQL
jgi:adenosylhomocysteine nucleosidase